MHPKYQSDVIVFQKQFNGFYYIFEVIWLFYYWIILNSKLLTHAFISVLG